MLPLPTLNLYLHFPAILFQSNLISNPKRMKANIINPESMDSWLEYTPLAGLAWSGLTCTDLWTLLPNSDWAMAVEMLPTVRTTGWFTST